MNNANVKSQAFPVLESWNDEHPEVLVTRELGLTKREYFAGLAMQSMIMAKGISTFNVSRNIEGVRNDIAEASVCMADALLNELNP